MITYLYWTAILAVAGIAVLAIGYKAEQWKLGITVGIVILALGWSAYYFRLQQVFVKRYGGVMSIQVPPGMHHLGSTWKDDNLWIENYDPKTNTCVFTEYSKGNLLQGKVSLKNCNPLLPMQGQATTVK